jgi:hypothetical protein
MGEAEMSGKGNGIAAPVTLVVYPQIIISIVLE